MSVFVSCSVSMFASYARDFDRNSTILWLEKKYYDKHLSIRIYLLPLGGCLVNYISILLLYIDAVFVLNVATAFRVCNKTALQLPLI